ncbi:co-chaperone DjlA [Porticoccus sp. W117]|uniref:co-chaperone DjlA n=1 Tax=Porticoccus sp. W117 TaxID=3054777 RepID=UPI00259231C3|nr:co-chaperone DjlA [Porticoccus sp. W117]MDM3869739.1 co-chaperone DjlA [Porticoccus sp. W117]
MIKIIGAVIGFLLFNIPGAILGFLFAGSFERFQNYGSGGFNPFTQGNRQAVFLRTVFLLKGKLAKADGHISQAEVDHTENFIRQLGMSAEHRQQAIEWFKQGSAADFHIEQTLQEFMAACGQTRNLPQVLLVYLIVMAMADGVMDSAEEALLRFIGSHLGYSEAQFRQLLEMTLNQSHFSGGGGAASPSALDEAYKALGVESSCTDQELKRAYRKLMSQYHPDKLMGQGVPEDMLKVATEQAKEIQAAYDLIKKNRGL